MGGAVAVVADVFAGSAAVDAAATVGVDALAVDTAATVGADALATGGLDAAAVAGSDAAAAATAGTVADAGIIDSGVQPLTGIIDSGVQPFTGAIDPGLLGASGADAAALSSEATGSLSNVVAGTPESVAGGSDVLAATPEGGNVGTGDALTRSLSGNQLESIAPQTAGQTSIDPINIANNSADPIGTLNAANNWTGTMTSNIGQMSTELAAQGYSESEIATFLQSQYGIDEYAAANAAGIAAAGGSSDTIASTLAADYGANMTGVEAAGKSLTAADILKTGKDVLTTASAAKNVAGLLAGKPTATAGAGAGAGASPFGSAASALSPSSGLGTLPQMLKETMLTSSAPSAGSSAGYSSQLKQLMSGVDPRIMNALGANPPSYYTYGGGSNFMGGAPATPATNAPVSGGSTSAGLPTHFLDTPSSASMVPSTSNQLSAAGLKALTQGALPTFRKGGNVHHPEFITGATGHYVKGRGDGQSDDIPAMLADGEYVFDADTVAALGNGSSDAGAKLLDHFRESLRDHKRSAPADKIPPKAAPLAYMKEALRKHKG